MNKSKPKVTAAIIGAGIAGLSYATKLGFYGDWLNGGRVEGAWLRGHKLANAINI